jgi:hypothetical protein
MTRGTDVSGGDAWQGYGQRKALRVGYFRGSATAGSSTPASLPFTTLTQSRVAGEPGWYLAGQPGDTLAALDPGTITYSRGNQFSGAVTASGMVLNTATATYAVNSVVFAFISWNTTGTCTAPAGWTQLDNKHANAIALGVWWRLITTPEVPNNNAGTYTWTFGTVSNNYQSMFVEVIGADTTTPVNAFVETNQATSQSTITSGSLTPVWPRTYCLPMVWMTTTTSSQSWSNTTASWITWLSNATFTTQLLIGPVTQDYSTAIQASSDPSVTTSHNGYSATLLINAAGNYQQASETRTLPRSFTDDFSSAFSDSASRALQTLLRSGSDTVAALSESAAKTVQAFLRTGSDTLPDTGSPPAPVVVQHKANNLSVVGGQTMTHTPTSPPTAGNSYILEVLWNDSSANNNCIPPDSTWSYVERKNTSTGISLFLFWHTVLPGETSWVFSFVGTQASRVAQMLGMEISGADPVNPIDGHSATNVVQPASSVTTGSLTPLTMLNCLSFAAINAGGSSFTYSGVSAGWSSLFTGTSFSAAMFQGPTTSDFTTAQQFTATYSSNTAVSTWVEIFLIAPPRAVKALSQSKTSSDTLTSLSDSVVRAAQAFLRSFTDNFSSSFSDSASRALQTFARTLSDTLAALSDSVGGNLNIPRTVADTLSALSDTAVRGLQSFARTVADTLAAQTDAANYTRLFAKTALDSLAAVSDSVARHFLPMRTASDTIAALSEFAVKGKYIILYVTETLDAMSEAIVPFITASPLVYLYPLFPTTPGPWEEWYDTFPDDTTKLPRPK